MKEFLIKYDKFIVDQTCIDEFIQDSPEKQSRRLSKNKSIKNSSDNEEDVVMVNDDFVDTGEDHVDDDPDDDDEDLVLSEYQSIKSPSIKSPPIKSPPSNIQHSVVVCSLLKLFRPYSFSAVPTLEQQRRAYVVSHAIRFATQEMSKVNQLANMLMTLYLLDCIQHNRAIPLLLCDLNTSVWNWCMLLTSTENGRHKDHVHHDKPLDAIPPFRIKSKKKKSSTEQDPSNSLQEKMDRKNQMNLLQMKPMMPQDFKWPDRSGLSEMQGFECKKRMDSMIDLILFW